MVHPTIGSPERSNNTQLKVQTASQVASGSRHNRELFYTMVVGYHNAILAINAYTLQFMPPEIPVYPVIILIL